MFALRSPSGLGIPGVHQTPSTLQKCTTSVNTAGPVSVLTSIGPTHSLISAILSSLTIIQILQGFGGWWFF